MNAMVLKWLTSGIVGLVVCSAVWLANSVKLHPSAMPYQLAVANSSVTQTVSKLERTPLPAEYAASSVRQSAIALR